MKKSLIVLLLCLTLPLPAFAAKGDASSPIYEKSFMLPGNISGSVTALTDGNRSGTVSNVDQAIASAQSVAALFNPNDPGSTVAMMNAKAFSEPVALEPQVARLLELALNVNDWTHGAFDVTNMGLSRKIKVHKGSSTVQFKKPEIKVSFDGILYGYLADLLAQSIYNSGNQNFMVKVGGVSRSQGQSTVGPWRIDIAEDNGKYAQRGLSLQFSGMSVAVVGLGHDKPLVNPRNNAPLNGNMKGLALLGRDGATTQAIAWGMYSLSAGAAQSLAAELQNLRYVIVDSSGTLIKSPGL